MDTMVQMSDVMVRRDPTLEWRGMVCVAKHSVEWAFGKSGRSELTFSTWRLEEKCNWISIYSHIVPSTTSFTSL